MLPYGLPRNHNAWDWDERGCKSQVNKISSKRRKTSRRIFKKKERALNRHLTNREKYAIITTSK